jgi:hypothetical protein
MAVWTRQPSQNTSNSGRMIMMRVVMAMPAMVVVVAAHARRLRGVARVGDTSSWSAGRPIT